MRTLTTLGDPGEPLMNHRATPAGRTSYVPVAHGLRSVRRTISYFHSMLASIDSMSLSESGHSIGIKNSKVNR